MMTVCLWLCAITAVFFRSFRWFQLSLALLIHSILLSLSWPNKIDHFIQYWRRQKCWVYLYNINSHSKLFPSEERRNARKIFGLSFALLKSSDISRKFDQSQTTSSKCQDLTITRDQTLRILFRNFLKNSIISCVLIP